MIEKHFQEWDYFAVPNLEQLCETLPILTQEQARTFFNRANQVTKGKAKAVERQKGSIFESLMGVVNASDRKDFSVRYELSSENFTNGILMLETFDSVISVVFCVARVSATSFLTYTFAENIEAIKGLREMKSSAETVIKDDSKKWWQFWK